MSRQGTARRVFTVLIVLSLVLLATMIRPFVDAFVFAAVLAGTLFPLHRRLTRALRGRASVSAGLLSALVVLALLLPLGGVGAFVVREAVLGVRFVNETVQSEGMEGLLDTLPEPVQNLADKLLTRFSIDAEGLDESLSDHARAQGGKAAKMVRDALAATGTVLLQTTMMLIAFFSLLVDGQQLVDWIDRNSPLEPGQTRELMREFRRVSAAVVVSSLATASVQAAAALVGYLIAGVPHPIFFATLTLVFALVPAIGAGGVCLVAALLLLAQGSGWMALFLAVWGMAVVGLVGYVAALSSPS